MKSYKFTTFCLILAASLFGSLFFTDTKTSYAGDVATFEKLKSHWDFSDPKMSHSMNGGILSSATFTKYDSSSSEVHESYEKKSEEVKKEDVKPVAYTPVKKVALYKSTSYKPVQPVKKPVVQTKVVYVEKKVPTVINNYEKSEKHETKNETHVMHYNIVMADHKMDQDIDDEKEDWGKDHRKVSYEKYQYSEDEDCPEEGDREEWSQSYESEKDEWEAHESDWDDEDDDEDYSSEHWNDEKDSDEEDHLTYAKR